MVTACSVYRRAVKKTRNAQNALGKRWRALFIVHVGKRVEASACHFRERYCKRKNCNAEQTTLADRLGLIVLTLLRRRQNEGHNDGIGGTRNELEVVQVHRTIR